MAQSKLQITIVSTGQTPLRHEVRVQLRDDDPQPIPMAAFRHFKHAEEYARTLGRTRKENNTADMEEVIQPWEIRSWGGYEE